MSIKKAHFDESIESYNLLVEMLNIQEEAIKLELYLMCDRAHVTLSHMTRVLTIEQFELKEVREV